MGFSPAAGSGLQPKSKPPAKPVVLLFGCKPLPASEKSYRYIRYLQICYATANAEVYFRLLCAKGGGTAYAVTQGRHTVISQTIPQSPRRRLSLHRGASAAAGITIGKSLF